MGRWLARAALGCEGAPFQRREVPAVAEQADVRREPGVRELCLNPVSFGAISGQEPDDVGPPDGGEEPPRT